MSLSSAVSTYCDYSLDNICVQTRYRRLFITLDRLTGVLRSTERVEDRLVDEVGSCRPIRVVPKKL
jgi:hypothetical protein